MAGYANFANLAIPIGLIAMRIVAASTPELSTAFANTLTSGQLFSLAHRFNANATPFPDVDHKSAREILTRTIILKILTGVQDAHFAFQMTLLANAIPSRDGQPGRINDVSC